MIMQFAHSISEVVNLCDSSPAWKSEHSQSQFSMLSIASNIVCQQSITCTYAIEDCLYAGTIILCACSKLEIKSLENLIAKKH